MDEAFKGIDINPGILGELVKWAGTTVTIYTKSGGASGCGFTGVLILCNPCFVRLITCIGPAPCCSLGSSCVTPCCPTFINNETGGIRKSPRSGFGDGRRNGRCFSGCCGGFGRGLGSGAVSNVIANVGAVVDIPVESIVAFVHNAI